MLDAVNPTLKAYIEAKILPQYAKNDSGHGAEHIRYVLRRCFEFSSQFNNINPDMLYTAACFHDIAHHINKKNHEKLSAEMFYADSFTEQYFTESQRQIIAHAIYDHRASANAVPRNDYGKILSSADRSTDITDFLKRTHAYTVKHQPNLSTEQMVERAYCHALEKYGKSGYAKHYAIDPEYENFRNHIKNLLENRQLFEAEYKRINNL